MLSHRNRSSNFSPLYLLCIYYCVSFEVEEGVVHVWGKDYVSRRHPWMISMMTWTKKGVKLFCRVDPQLTDEDGGQGFSAWGDCCPPLLPIAFPLPALRRSLTMHILYNLKSKRILDTVFLIRIACMAVHFPFISSSVDCSYPPPPLFNYLWTLSNHHCGFCLTSSFQPWGWPIHR